MASDLNAINAPDELRGLPGWVVWRYVQQPGDAKPRKVPFYTNGERRTGKAGGPADRAHLTDFESARRYAIKHGCDGVGLDWGIDIGSARRRVGDKVALQGNIDPNVRFGTPETIAAEAKKVLDSFGPGNTGHVFNLGHGISQYTPPENVTVLVETVHAHSRTLRK